MTSSGNAVPSAAERHFNKLKQRLTAATGSSGLTSFHDGRVCMTLVEWQRLISCIERTQSELRRHELHHFEEEQICSSAHAVLDEIRERCRAMDRGIGYRVSGDHSTWGEYHEGKHDFAGEIEDILDRADPVRAATHTRSARH